MSDAMRGLGAASAREHGPNVEKLLRAMEMLRVAARFIRTHAPEEFAARYSTLIWGVSGRTVRRWNDGQTTPHPSVVNSLAGYDFAAESAIRARQAVSYVPSRGRA